MLYTIDVVEVDINEVARYLGYGTQCIDDRVAVLAQGLIAQLRPSCKIWWEEYAVNQLPFTSEDLQRHLQGCEKSILFGATLGIAFDRLLQKKEVTSPAEAVILQAVGTAAIEAACDTFCNSFGKTTPRFSPGYGDFALKNQTKMFELLDLNRKLGITLTDSLLMVPTKSVTALFGLGGQPCAHGCKACTKSCAYRKEE